MNASPVKSCVILLTGLSGAGKTTIAQELVKQLKEQQQLPVLLDGDDIRNAIQLTSFDEEARKKHNLTVGALAALLEAQGHIVIVALIAPYRDVRDMIREQCKQFLEVYVSTPLAVCRERDVKGLYAKAERGEIKEFTGISAPYYPPVSPELVLDTAALSVKDCTAQILKLLSHA